MKTQELSSQLRVLVSTLHKMMRRRNTLAYAYSMTEIETISILLNNGSMLPTDLAVKTQITTPSMSQILKKFENDGVIIKTPSTEDKRKVIISLSDPWRKKIETMRYERDEYLKGLMDKKLTKEEKALLEKALPVLSKLTAL